jgi:hypothetical protein
VLKLSICTRGYGCIERPAFPTPSIFQGGRFLHNSGASRREIAEACLVIARSEATKQSILSLCGKMDCFASLAMTILAV